MHLNDPGRADWEGVGPGTRALAAGGATCCVDMPLNAHPPTLDGASFDAKVAAAAGAARVDFALWGGLVPGPLDRLDELAARGVVGLKAFMCPSGIDDFPAVDEDALGAGMARAARLGLPVAVHAENAELTEALAARAVAEGRTGMRDFLASRPVEAELRAIARALALAEETGCALHVVHVSSGRGVRLVAEARARGVDVTCETCPHYLVLDAEDAEALGAVAKCAPPLRGRADREELWAELRAGRRGLGGLGPLAQPAGAEGRRRPVRRLGRHRRGPDHAGPAPHGRPGPRPGRPARRVPGRPAPTGRQGPAGRRPGRRPDPRGPLAAVAAHRGRARVPAPLEPLRRADAGRPGRDHHPARPGELASAGAGARAPRDPDPAGPGGGRVGWGR